MPPLRCHEQFSFSLNNWWASPSGLRYRGRAIEQRAQEDMQMKLENSSGGRMQKFEPFKSLLRNGDSL